MESKENIEKVIGKFWKKNINGNQSCNKLQCSQQESQANFWDSITNYKDHKAHISIMYREIDWQRIFIQKKTSTATLTLSSCWVGAGGVNLFIIDASKY